MLLVKRSLPSDHHLSVSARPCSKTSTHSSELMHKCAIITSDAPAWVHASAAQQVSDTPQVCCLSNCSSQGFGQQAGYDSSRLQEYRLLHLVIFPSELKRALLIGASQLRQSHQGAEVDLLLGGICTCAPFLLRHFLVGNASGALCLLLLHAKSSLLRPKTAAAT